MQIRQFPGALDCIFQKYCSSKCNLYTALLPIIAGYQLSPPENKTVPTTRTLTFHKNKHYFCLNNEYQVLVYAIHKIYEEI